MNDWLTNFGDTVNNSFYFVVDKLIDLQEFFIRQAWGIGRVVLLIAILTAALNYALTGQGLKENIIKIMKATLFFIIVTLAYPKIIGFISWWTFNMAYESVYPSVAAQFNHVTTVEFDNNFSVDITSIDNSGGNNRMTFTRKLYTEVKDDRLNKLFPNLTKTREHPQMVYSTVAPAAVINLVFMLAGECFTYADQKKAGFHIPEFSRILKGLICAFFIILTGVFALLEYLICFLEFMLVASVGVILFPLSIWEGSKFMSEKFIGAIVGFFIKLLFCSIAVCLMIYGFASMFFILAAKGDGFGGTADQIVFIIFACLLFFYICKSAPGLAQSLLTGTPSLSATGAISAAGGAIAAAGATMGMAKAAGGKAAGTAAKAAFGAQGALSEAGAAAGAVIGAGGRAGQVIGAFGSSLAGTAKDAVSAKGLGLARSLLGGGPGSGGSGGGANPYSWRDAFIKNTNDDGEQMSFSEYRKQRKDEGEKKGLDYLINNP